MNEHPCFVISMNAEPQSFPDEVVKRCLMVYTNTSLPSHERAARRLDALLAPVTPFVQGAEVLQTGISARKTRALRLHAPRPLIG